MSNPGSAARGLVLCFSALWLAAGCVHPSLSQVSAFGSASEDLAASAKKGFELIDSSNIDRNVYDVASDLSLHPEDQVFEGLFKSIKEGDALQQRLALLEAVGMYAGSLQALATADASTGIDKTSKELYGSLVGLKERYQATTGKPIGLTDSDLGLISTAVDAIGKAIAEKKRRKALKHIILTVDTAVQSAAQLIAGELGEGSESTKQAIQSLKSIGGTLRQVYNRQKAAMSFDARYAMLDQIHQFHKRAEDAPAFFRNVSQGAKSFGDAHAALKQAIEKDEFTSTELVRNIGFLVEQAKAAKAFRESLSKDE